MAFSVASWNVEHFGKKRPGESRIQVGNRVTRVFDFLRAEIDADIYAIYEVRGSAIFNKVKTDFPEYSWRITEGGGSQQILIGHRIPVFMTERTEFAKGFGGPLRPGALVTVTQDAEDFPMLFLHLKAADAPIDFGVRVHQHQKARSLRKALDRAGASDRANFIVAGDLNNVGLGLTFSPTDISEIQEIERLQSMYGSNFDKMEVKTKSQTATFWNGPGASDPPADLDHVIAARHIEFEEVAGSAVQVIGWPQLDTPAQQGDWIRRFSDHALLRFNVTGVKP